MNVAEFEDQVYERVEQALTVADVSPDVGNEEPCIVALVQLIEAHPEHRAVAEDQLIKLAARLATTPAPLGAVELLAYVVHTLDLPRLVAAIEGMRSSAESAGAAGRPREWARRYELVLAARASDWSDRDLFRSLTPE